jgi:hypothetical protein
MFLITGSGRSGTKYMATVLRACGLNVGHERLGRDGIVSGFYAFDAPRYPGRRHPAPRPKFDTVLHQVREPLATIGSLTTGRHWRWSRQFTALREKNPPPLRRACYVWLAFNQAAERQAVFTYRIEDLRDYWSALQTALNFTAEYEAVAHISHNINTRAHAAITWDDIARVAPEIVDDIITTSRGYGYG